MEEISTKQESPFDFEHIKSIGKKRAAVLTAVFSAIILYYFLGSAPADFPVNKRVNVPEGASAGKTAEIMKSEGIIRSSYVLRSVIFLTGNAHNISAGDYLFKKPEGVFTVASRLWLGEYNLTPVKITVPEGTASFDMVRFFGDDFYNFDRNKFEELAALNEGYLFPDTYYFLPNITAEGAVKTMRDNFSQKMKMIDEDIKNSGVGLKEIIIMASILEKEARKPEDMRLVSGILWKRITMGMALQVDAPFAYISDKSTYELTTKDLKQDSPYNTYKNRGLPPTPIGNPGLEAISAALHPKESKYLFYLSDRSGKIYYSASYAEQVKNKALYLNSK